MGKIGLGADSQNLCNFGTQELKTVTGTSGEPCKAAGERGWGAVYWHTTGITTGCSHIF